MLYTRKGDNGTTKTFDAKPGERISKSSCRTESLGALDELNSFLGLIKVKLAGVDWKLDLSTMPGLKDNDLTSLIHWIQNSLFTVQAEVAGADKRVPQAKVDAMEKLVDGIEKELPPIKTFFVSGGSELAALFDVSRTLARKAERRVIAAADEGSITLQAPTLAFMNRLSSLLYALARFSNFKAKVKEMAPLYD